MTTVFTWSSMQQQYVEVERVAVTCYSCESTLTPEHGINEGPPTKQLAHEDGYMVSVRDYSQPDEYICNDCVELVESTRCKLTNPCGICDFCLDPTL